MLLDLVLFFLIWLLASIAWGLICTVGLGLWGLLTDWWQHRQALRVLEAELATLRRGQI